ncbi:hypothetical protein PG997_013983 [Apiospora hydei]|uniref:F-box domain-containing protein n=1 Tax=Apiospora hydei TaxID=1337664 RepID=A0ABR1VAA8_9PEZI
MSQSQNSRLSSLPNELTLQILGELDWRDVRSITLLNGDFRWRFVDYWFDVCYESEVNSKSKSEWCVLLFCHAVKTNSSEIVQYLATRKNDLDLTGFQARQRVDYPWVCANESYLHMAITGDAPYAASFLVKLGSDVDGDIGHCPDLPALCLALARVNMSSQRERDTALRIACSNTLPRIAAHLLAKGADPNSVSPFGLGALHVTLMRRPLPSIVHGSQRFIAEFDVYSLLRLLLDYGAAVDLPTQTTRAHICGPQCWKSMQCDHSGQTGLHLAAASGFPMCALLLLDNGANHRHQNAGGYTALYTALCQANRGVANILLKCSSEANPVVKFPQGVTTLHIACRFAYTDMANAILLRGADVNATDPYGNTPLHEALCQMGPGRTADVVETLRLLAEHGADPDISSRAPTPRQKAEAHPSYAVREMFILGKAKPSRILPLAASSEVREPSNSSSSKNAGGGPKPVDKTEHVIRGFGESPRKGHSPERFHVSILRYPKVFPLFTGVGPGRQSTAEVGVRFYIILE